MIYLTFFIYIATFIILIVSLFLSAKSMRNKSLDDGNQTLTVYQYSEITVGTMIFLLLFFIYKFFVDGNVDLIDVLYTTGAFGLIFFMGKIVGNWVDLNEDEDNTKDNKNKSLY